MDWEDILARGGAANIYTKSGRVYRNVSVWAAGYAGERKLTIGGFDLFLDVDAIEAVEWIKDDA